MAQQPISASPLARAGATAGSVAAAAGIVSFSWGSLWTTQALASGIVGLSAIFLHLRHTAAQMAARALWMSSGLLAALTLTLGPSRERVASALVLLGSSVATFLMGRSGLRGGLPGAFEPARYRIPLLISLGLASADALGFTFYGLMFLEAWGVLTNNLLFAAGLGVGIYGLARMRTWGLLVLAAVHAAIAGTAFFGNLHLPLVLKGIYGVSSLAALVGLSPLLALAAKKLLRAESPAPPERVRVASFGAAAVAGEAAHLQGEIDAEIDALADGDRLAARESTAARRPRLDRDQHPVRVRA
jgi:hypothetical protein